MTVHTSVRTQRPTLAAARMQFAEQGAVPVGSVAEPILRSWRRCADLGFDMHDARRHQEVVTAAELRFAQQRNDVLQRFCAPALDRLVEFAQRSDALAILADAQGLVLETRGDPVFAVRASRVALMPGARWDEGEAGTNAIGTALAEGRAIMVHGDEHFFEPNHILTCSAMPINDPRGRMLGVLDLSGPARDVPRALERVREAVDLAEHALFEHDCGSCTVLRLHREASLLGKSSEALLAFEDDVLVAANRYALAWLTLESTALGVFRYQDIFGGDLRDTHEVRRTRDGLAFHARLDAPARRTLGTSRNVAVPRDEIVRVAPTVQSRKSVDLILDVAARASLSRAIRMLDADVAVLLQGETGTGKEVFAREMHARSCRASKPFVAINCAAVPESLIEAELFGYESGAFTGARRQGHKGLLRQAEGGVLFLDEIGDMPLPLQARLLRVLQEREVTPLGGASPVALDFALICATHRPLSGTGSPQLVRPDLYFRIAEYTVALEPLRARSDRHLIVRRLWQSLGANTALPGEIDDALSIYEWPGNFRQLVSVLRALKVLAGEGGVVQTAMLPAEILARIDTGAQTTKGTTFDSQPSLKIAQDERIVSTLERCNGNISQAAQILGIHRSTLYRHLASVRDES